MLIFIFLLIIFSANEMRIAKANEFHTDYMSYRQTTAINGIFVLLVFLSHISMKISLTGTFDAGYIVMKKYLLQMVVVPFLFYSGYGTMESIRTKERYVQNIPVKRALKILLHFDLAVVLYLVVQAVVGRFFDIRTMFLSLFGWETVGNSNWYIFVMLVLYLIVFIAFMLSGTKRYWIGAFLTLAMTIAYIILMVKIGQATRFYNTILLFPMGMFWSLSRSRLEPFIQKNDLTYFLTTTIVFAIYSYFALHHSKGLVYYLIWGILFMMLVLLATMKIHLDNAFLNWFGKNIFGIYILQRIPMIIIKYLGWDHRPYLFIVACLIATMLMTEVFNLILGKIDQKLFPKKS